MLPDFGSTASASATNSATNLDVSASAAPFQRRLPTPENPFGKPPICEGCPAFRQPGPVWEDGPADAASLYLLEAPGSTEAQVQGDGRRHPAVGRTGKYLASLLRFVGERREFKMNGAAFTGIDASVRCGNAVACLPPEKIVNGKPENPVTEEIFLKCRPHWERLMQAGGEGKLKHVHAMGKWAARRFVGGKASIDTWQGSRVTWGELDPGVRGGDQEATQITFSIHPARAMRERMMMPVVQEHFRRAARASLGEPIPRRKKVVMDLDAGPGMKREAWGGVEVIGYSPEMWEKLLPDTGMFFFDTETTNRVDRIIERISFATCDRGVVTVAWSAKIREMLRATLENPRIVKIAHNFQFDWEVLHKAGLTIPYAENGWVCTMTASAILAPDTPNDLEFATMMASPADFVPWKFTSEADPVAYSGVDSWVLPRLWEWQAARLEEDSLRETFDRTMAVFPVGLKMKVRGLEVDLPVALKERVRLLAEIESGEKIWEQEAISRNPERIEGAVKAVDESRGLEAKAEAYREIRRAENLAFMDRGVKKRVSENPLEARRLSAKAKELREFAVAEMTVSFRSPKQLARLLYTDFGLPIQMKRGTETVTTDETALMELLALTQDPLLREILVLRSKQKVATTFFGEAMTGEKTEGRFHFSVNFTRNNEMGGKSGACTGRWSAKPSPQVMPEELRHVWLADGVIVAADWKSAEIYAVAYMTGKVTGDWGLWEFVSSGKDIYRRFAGARLGKSEEAVTGEERQEHKRYALGINYGMSARKGKLLWGCDEAEAKRIIAAYLDSMFSLRKFREWAIEMGVANRFLKNPFGRLRYFPDDSFGAEMLNFYPQTIVAEMLNITHAAIEEKMIAAGLTEGIGVWGGKMPSLASAQGLSVHDAIYLDVRRDRVGDAIRIITETMPRDWGPWMPGFKVPVDLKIGTCYRPQAKGSGIWDGKDLIHAGEWVQIQRETAARLAVESGGSNGG